ncbi:MAG: NADH-quinone oxidoreductase subunit M [Chloroflexota bacterium]|nr:NADH-quinone oxidoreductase subunit M [Chloroflexota bacterium]
MIQIFGIDALSVLIFGPALAAFVVAAMASLGPSKSVGRWTALIFSLLFAILSIAVFLDYQAAAPAIGDDQFVVAQDVEWFSALGARWTLGIDGISVVMILLTGILTPLAILASWNIEDRSNMHMALLLFFETGSMGVFAAMDLMVFFLFYELTLVPMYFLINQWGSLPKAGFKYSGRFYASTKFMIYSFGGTLGMLLATQLIGWSAGTYNMAELVETWPLFRQGEALLGIDVSTVKALAFAGFFVAFSIKVPIWPFHTWLPDAHGEAPTAGSMLLAGIMLKLGAYGFIRLVIPLFPDVWLTEVVLIGVNVATLFAILSVVGIVLGAFAAFGQNDIKRLVAYSSVNHMGFVGIGIAVVAQIYSGIWSGAQPDADVQTAILAANGTVLQMFNHGLSSAGMFLLAGALYHKTHTRDLDDYGGLWVKAPVMGAILIFTSLASLGLPGLNGFVSEFLIVRGAWPVFTGLTAIAMIGLLFTGGYILKGIRAVLHGPFNLRWRDYDLELTPAELLGMIPLMFLILLTGVYPNWILPTINATVTTLFAGLTG